VRFVVDASISAAWAFEDENTPGATVALEKLQSGSAHVPGHWWFELRNALLVNERRGRITEAGTSRFLRDLAGLSITVDRSPDENTLLGLARRHRLTVYDAAYLELARREGLPLASLGGDLRAAAPAEGVPLLGA
jgi:predicted nucleic acid-binding protein